MSMFKLSTEEKVRAADMMAAFPEARLVMWKRKGLSANPHYVWGHKKARSLSLVKLVVIEYAIIGGAFIALLVLGAKAQPKPENNDNISE